MQRDFAPGLAAALQTPELREAVGQSVREIVRQGVYGSNDALAELAAKQEKEHKSAPLGSIGAFFSKRTWLLVLLVVAAVFSLPLAWLLKQRAESNRYRQEAERRRAEASVLLRAIDAAGDNPLAADLMRLLRKQLAEEAEPETPPVTPPTPSHA
jgi:hypothetical protein